MKISKQFNYLTGYFLLCGVVTFQKYVQAFKIHNYTFQTIETGHWDSLKGDCYYLIEVNTKHKVGQ